MASSTPAMPNLVVAIPVRDEAALIGDCLRALALQQAGTPPAIVLLVNNSTDGTAAIARALQPTLPCALHVIEHDFAGPEANAGFARRLAMAKAAMLCAPGGVVMTTDADGCVAPDWIAANLAAFARGADCVCGRAIIDPLDALQIPQHLHDDDALETHYAAQLDRLAALADPDAYDPWPRHGEESGASIAVRREAFLAAGGVPAIPCGEDRALVDALRRTDARIRHDPAITVTVSGRITGRAAGGMADTIRRRIQHQDVYLDSRLEPVRHWVRRGEMRRVLRLAWADPSHRPALLASLAVELGLSFERLEGWMTLPCFGAAWALVEAATPALARMPVLRSAVHEQIALAARTLQHLAAARPRV